MTHAWPTTGLIAVHDAPGSAFALRDYPLRAPQSGEVLVKVRMATICRSDLHSYHGHRPSPCPGVLGHEIIGDIVALGDGVQADLCGERLAVGDRITWSEYFMPARDVHSEVLNLPHKAVGVDKYGHRAVDEPPHHHGGFAQYCYILPQTWILKLPAVLTDAEAAPLNCGVATMAAVIEQAAIELGQRVVIQGLGLLGLYGAAMAKARGASRVVAVEPDARRAAWAARFGVDAVVDPSGLDDAALAQAVRDALAGPLPAGATSAGADAVIEVCGQPGVIASGMLMLRTGGRYVIAGLVNPGSAVQFDGNLLMRKLIHLVGVHNYHPRHLLAAREFVVAQRDRYPFHSLVDACYPLADVGRAMTDAAQRQVLRAAIVPSMAPRCTHP